MVTALDILKYFGWSTRGSTEQRKRIKLAFALTELLPVILMPGVSYCWRIPGRMLHLIKGAREHEDVYVVWRSGKLDEPLELVRDEQPGQEATVLGYVDGPLMQQFEVKTSRR